VVLDGSRRSWLDDAYAAAPVRVGKVATLDAWLSLDSDSNGQRVAANIGSQRVGEVDAAIRPRFAALIESLAPGRVPLVAARLAPVQELPCEYLLVVRIPALPSKY
jgi:hypothetical protein